MNNPGTVDSRTGNGGFTLTELVMIILLLGIVSVVAVTRFPSDMDRRGAVLEFRQAVRSSQHLAMSRGWNGPASAWGIRVSGNRYYVGRADVDCVANCNQSGCGDQLLCNRSLNGDASMALTPATAVSSVFFNGLGEPIDTAGNLLPSVSFTIDGSVVVMICAETGFVLEASSCP